MYKSFTEVKSALASGISLLDIVKVYLQRIHDQSDLNAFLEVFEDTILEDAHLVSDKIKAGTAGKLAGLVIGIKDNICYKNHLVSGSSRILEGFESLFTATALQRLLDEDAIVIGRLNCDEFAMGSSNENSAFGPVKNPLDKTKVPGGSSGGSAAAVAAHLCTVALGSDTGGSIRQPASFTGTFGIKPTYGRVSRYGLIAYASSFDQIGVFATTIEDTALVMEIMSGKDNMDSTSSSKEVGCYTIEDLTYVPKVAYITECLSTEGLDPTVKNRMAEIIELLENKGVEVVPVSFPYIEFMVPTYYVLSTAEASSNLARFDGVHYGYRSKEAAGVEATYKKSRSEAFGEEVKRRIMAGTFVLSHEYYDAYYTKAQKVRRILQEKTNDLFSNVDFIITPTTPAAAFKINEMTDPIQMYLQDIFTVHANLTGNPAISLPLGKDNHGMPFGIQVMSSHFDEKTLLDFSAYLCDSVL